MSTTVDVADRVAERYTHLGLRLGRLQFGLVDSWIGDPELAARIGAAPPEDPWVIAVEAAETRAALLDAPPSARTRFLAAQLEALACTARRLGGDRVPFREQIRTCYGVDVGVRGDPGRYAETHEEISALLGGHGPLRDRVEAFYDANAIPVDKLLPATLAVSEAVREIAVPLFGLPPGERVDYDVVDDAPWNAFNRYLGDHRSAITLNVSSGRTIAAMPLIVTHEAYGGHHAEHCLKEELLVHGRGEHEHELALVHTPECLLAEGLAECALDTVLGPGWGAWTEEVLAEVDVRIDGPLVERMLGLVRRLLPVRVDAMLMAHEEGVVADEVTEYFQRWLLLPHDRAEHMTRFVLDPLWCSYGVTYVLGAGLVDRWLAARPAGQNLAERFRELLTEPLTPADLGSGPATGG